jgi:hypothetical protein
MRYFGVGRIVAKQVVVDEAARQWQCEDDGVELRSSPHYGRRTRSALRHNVSSSSSAPYLWLTR